MTNSYRYDGQDVLQQTSGGTVLTYVHGPAVDETLASEDAGGVRKYFHVDGLGSVAKTTSQGGVITDGFQYNAFGVLESSSSPAPYGFTGREWEYDLSSSGVVALGYYRARYYDPKLGRFLTEDPLPLAARPVEETNAYVYVRNNPVNRVDPFGLQSGDLRNEWRVTCGSGNCNPYPPMCPFEPDKCAEWGPQWKDWGFSSSNECLRWVWLRTGGTFITGRLASTPTGRAVGSTWGLSTSVGSWLACNGPVCLRWK